MYMYFLGLHNPLDTLYHLQPFMTLTLMPLAFYIEGGFSIFWHSLPAAILLLKVTVNDTVIQLC